MMIQDDRVDAPFAQPVDGFNGSRAAIHGEEQRHRKFLQAILHAVAAQAVAFVHAVRQITMHRPAEAAEDFREQGGGGDAVDVVVAEDHERFAAVARLEQPLDGGAHIREQKGIAELFQARLKKAGDERRVAESAIQQALGEQGRNFQPGGKLAGQQRLGRRE